MGRIVATSTCKSSERPELTRTGWRLALAFGVEAVALCRRAQGTAISSIQQTMQRLVLEVAAPAVRIRTASNEPAPRRGARCALQEGAGDSVVPTN